jgi:prolyl-tRNA synthetase
MIYQIQTKFRDEARPRGGLIRVREFTMKDAYSFHTSQEDLNACYEMYHRAYERIYKRAGLKDVASVASDSGMMGGSLSHEFMYLTPIGEDSIAICGQCGYSANVEAAKNIVENEPASVIKDLELVETPNVKTIDDLCRFLAVEPKQICKAVVYQKKSDNSYVVLCYSWRFGGQRNEIGQSSWV